MNTNIPTNKNSPSSITGIPTNASFSSIPKQTQQDPFLFLEKFLRQEDKASLITEVQELNTSKAGRTLYLTIIQNYASGEAIILSFKKHDSPKIPFRIKYIIPIFAELRIIKTGFHNTYEFSFIGTVENTWTFKGVDEYSFLVFIEQAQTCHKRAQEERFFNGGKTHKWVKHYTNKKDEFRAQQRRASIQAFNRVSKTLSPDKIKARWIEKKMKERESEFSDWKKLSIFLGTWNVNGRKTIDNLKTWLIDQEHVIPDIFVIGFQELDLSAENFLLGSSPLESIWEEEILKTLNLACETKLKFTLLSLKRLVGVLLFIFVKDHLTNHITDLQTGSAPTGIMGMMGNKGGVAIRFNLYDSKLCFVNSHLNAHQENILRRNQDYNDISRRILFNTPDGENQFSIFEHDYLFWIGDLNYRLDLHDSEIRRLIQTQEWEKLIKYDQLLQQMKEGTAFTDFNEGKLLFRPSYKFDLITNDYELSDKRSPAWCDRILWKGKNVNQIYYRVHEVVGSDHRPVTSLVEVKVKSVISQKKTQVYLDVHRQLDKMENECRPSATLVSNSCDYGDVYYNIPKTLSVTLENNGKVYAEYQFIPKLNDSLICRRWIKISPTSGILLPGEKVSLEFTICIDNSTAPDLNIGKEVIEDILILKIVNGDDHFITISGNFKPSCFGNYLTNLVRYVGPLHLTKPLSIDSPNCLSIPKELWRIIDFINRKSSNEEKNKLFIDTGVENEMQKIIELLDTGTPFETIPNLSVHSMCAILIEFLDSLGEPVVPSDCYDKAMDCISLAQCKQLISNINSVHANVFYYLIAFLRQIIQKNSSLKTKLASLFGRVLIRPSNLHRKLTKTRVELDVNEKRTAFISYFLEETR